MLAAAVILSIAATSVFAQKPSNKPRVPPGVDPGGVAIAIIGNGVDYTRPEIAARLARDGEGEIIGWDFVDDDRRPYHLCDPRMGNHAHLHCDRDDYRAVLLAAPQARLIPMRVPDGKPNQVHVNAIRAVANTPARIVLLSNSFDDGLHYEFALEASRRFPKTMFIARAPDNKPPRTIETAVGLQQMPSNLLLTWDSPLAGAAAVLVLSGQPDLDVQTLRNVVQTKGAFGPFPPPAWATK
jgi:hypothetical protein